MWSQTRVDFSGDALFRYIKYEIEDSKNGSSCLSQVLIEPKPKNAKVIYCNSEDSEHLAENILNPKNYWLTNLSDKFKYPHILIIDLNEPLQLDYITTFSVPGILENFPKKMKIYASIDSKEWERVSELDLDKED